MNFLKLFTILASGLTLALVVILILIEDPMKSSYTAVMSHLQKIEENQNELFILQHYPKLQQALDCIEKADEIEAFARHSNQCQALPNNKNFTSLIKNQRQQIIDLRQEAMDLLEQLKVESKEDNTSV